VIDRDGDGYISAEDLQIVIQSLGGNPRESEIQEMIHEVDEDGKGTISFDEFLKIMARKSKTENDEDEDLKEAFAIFDMDGNGFVTAQEMQQVMSNFGISLSMEDVVEMIKSADVDGDGTLNIEEFYSLMRGKTSSYFKKE
jgi:calmodulin